MKLALLFLLCFAGVSYQQRASPRFYPRSYYQPLLNLYSNQYANKQLYPFNSYDDSEYYGNEGLESIDSDPQVQGRTPTRKNGIQSLYSPERSFFLPAAYLSSLFAAVPVATITSTVSTTTSLTATIASLVTCIPKAQFSTIGGAPLITTLTTACTANRRRRSEDQQTELEEFGISPSQIEQLEASALGLARIVRDVSGSNHPEILSSQQTAQEVEDRIDYGETRRKRFLTKFSSVVTTTSTITSYSFTTTTITKSLNIAVAGQLTCLPSCYSVCST